MGPGNICWCKGQTGTQRWRWIRQQAILCGTFCTGLQIKWKLWGLMEGSEQELVSGSGLNVLCSLSRCHCLGFMNFACTMFIYFLSYRIPKGKTKQGSRFFEEAVAVGKGRVHNEWHVVDAMTYFVNEGWVDKALPVIWLWASIPIFSSAIVLCQLEWLPPHFLPCPHDPHLARLGSNPTIFFKPLIFWASTWQWSHLLWAANTSGLDIL